MSKGEKRHRIGAGQKESRSTETPYAEPGTATASFARVKGKRVGKAPKREREEVPGEPRSHSTAREKLFPG